MTRYNFFRLAIAAGYSTQFHSSGNDPMRQEIFGGELETARLLRFAELVAAAEREACESECQRSSSKPECLERIRGRRQP